MARQMKDSGIEWIGEIPETWEICRLKDVYTSSIAGEVIDKNYWHSGSELLYTCQKTPMLSDYPDFPERKRTTSDDLLLTRNATPYIFIPENGAIYSNVVQKITIVNTVDRRFVRYVIKQGADALIVNGNTIPSYNMDIWSNIHMTLPSIEEQQCIVAFLDRKCAEIDAVIERTKATIEEYKKLKQAVITEAVTKGVRGPRPMKDSGIEWVGEIPEGWEVRKLGRFISIRSGITLGKTYPEDVELIERPYLRVANVKADGFALDDVATIEVTPDEAEKYALKAGELLMTEGGDRDKLGRGTVWNGEITPCLHQNHVFAVTCDETWLLTQYLAYLTASNVGRQYFDITAKKTTNLACTNSNTILQFKIPLPSTEEQQEIIEWLPIRCAALDTLIAKKTALLTELETYKKSLIYEYVTGKKECLEVVEQAAVIAEYPFFPAAVNTKRLRFAQAMMMAKVLDMHGKGMGRVKLEKMLYTIETSIGFDFDTEYAREAAGPLHESIYKCEGIISRQNHWYQLHQSPYGVSYTPTKDAGKYRAYYDKYFSSYNAEIERIIDIFKPYSTDQAEIVATLFAAWNDAIIDRKSFTDEDIVDDVLNNWHDNKKRFPKDVWLRAMEQMRKNNLIPKGYGKHTVMKAAEM